MDGVPVSVVRSFGAGLASGAWFQTSGGWYATPGQHTIEVTLDADNAIAETSETNNTQATPLTFTTALPTTLPQKFGNPMGGVLYHDWHFSNYADVDPTAGVRDFNGFGYSYDGHDAEDIGLPNFARMDTGIPVYAAADGTVESTADGNFDRNTSFGGQPANFVVINHGSDWKTKYFHFAANTVTVKPGDSVTAGQFLGLAGSSGISTGAHLHWEVEHHGNAVEPNFAPSEYFVSPLTYQRDAPTTIRDMGITNYIPADEEFAERPAEHSIFSSAVSQIALVWFKYSHFNVGDQFEVKWYRPDGTLNLTNTRTISADTRGGWYYFNRASGVVMANPGTWRVAVVKGGAELASRTFDVSTGPGAAGVKVSQGTTLIIDNRSSAWNFGTAAQNAAAPSQTFTINNHGTTSLSLSNLVLPPGFALNGAFPTSISRGTSATFTVDMTTSAVGPKFGAIQFDTNDPETPTFNFNVSGTITGAVPADSPVISLPAPALAYNILGTAGIIDATATISDTDTPDFAGGSLTVEFNSRNSAKDTLGIRHVGTETGQIGVNGSSVTYGGVPFGTFSSLANGGKLLVNFTVGATLAAVQELARHITFSTTATDPESLARYIRFTLLDDLGNTSNQPLAVAAQNLRPTTLFIENGNLLIADSSAAGKNDDWLMTRAGDNFILTDLSGNTIDVSSIPSAIGNLTSEVTLPFSLFTQSSRLLFDARTGSDLFKVNPTNGDPLVFAGIDILRGSLSFVGSPSNRAPTLAAIDNPQSILEDAATQFLPISDISSGPGESQDVEIAVTSSIPSLFSELTVNLVSAAAGMLAYRPAADRSGVAVIYVTVKDNGGTFASGINETTQSFTVQVLGVNDQPSFAPGGNQIGATINDEAGAITVPNWATNVSAGPIFEADQVLTFNLSLSPAHQSLFSVLPAINPTTGALTFTPKPNAKGAASLTVTLADDGGGTTDTSAPQTFTIDIAKPHPWHNSAAGTFGSLDVNGRDGITLIDAVMVINYLNSAPPAGPGSVPASAFTAPAGVPQVGYIDVAINGQNANLLSTLDALLIINYLNTPGGEGEPLALVGRRQLDAADAPHELESLYALLAIDAAETLARKRRS